MRQSRLLSVLSCLVLVLLLSPAGAKGESKLDGRLRYLQSQSASLPTLRRMSAIANINADAPVPTVAVLIKLAPGKHIEDLRRAHPAVEFHSEVGGIVTAVAPVPELAAFESDTAIDGVQHSHKRYPNLDVVRSISTSNGSYLGILEGAADLAVADGAGVVVGDIDTGIDYHHADFKDNSNNTRLLSIWDQKTAGTPPGGSFNGSNFNYGNECLPASINANTCSEVDADIGAPGHGTHVTGIMAGNGRATGNSLPAGRYVGVAKAANIIMVKSNLADDKIIDGMNYIVSKANAIGARAVVNMSLGSQYGPHDGSSYLERAIDAVAANTPVVVSMGNDNSGHPHTQFTVPSGLTVVSQVNSCTSGYGCYSDFGQTTVEAQYWFPIADFYNVSVTLNGSGGGTANYSSGSFGSTKTFSNVPLSCNGNNFFSNQFTVLVTTGSSGSGPTKVGNVEVDVDDGGMGVNWGCVLGSISVSLTRVVAGGSGVVDGYAAPAGDGSSFANFISPNGTMSSPSTANNVFSVAAYNTKNTWLMDITNSSAWDPPSRCGTGTNGYSAPIPALGYIADFSGAGPTRDNRPKPDVAAPGEGVTSSMTNDINPATYLAVSKSTAPGCKVVDDGKHMVDQGTSMAAPVVSGVIAVMLGVNPALTVPQIRTALQATARNDGGVQASGVAPNNFFGYGKVAAAPTKVRVGPTSTGFQVLGTSSVTFSWTTVANATSYNLYQAGPPNQFLQTVVTNSSTTLNLLPNTTYGISVGGVNGYGEGPRTSLFVAATLANPPVVGSVQPWISSVTVNFAPGAGGASGFVLYGSTDPSTFAGTLFSSSTASGAVANLTLTGLGQVTQYFLRLGALNQSGIERDVPAGSATTLNPYVAPPIVQAPSPSQNQMQFFWSQGANPSLVNYSAGCSTAPNFTGAADQNVSGVDIFTAGFSGLTANTSYYFRVKANISAYSSTGPYATLAGVPAANPPAFSGVSDVALTAQWGAGVNPAGTLFRAQASSTNFIAGNALASSDTFNTSAVLTGAAIQANTVYAARVAALNRTGTITSFLTLGSTLTLPAPPSAVSFTNQIVTGFTVNYTNGGNGPSIQFVAQISTDPTAAFYPVVASSQTFNTFASFSGLVPNAQYNFRAGALNSGGLNFSANSFLSLGVSTYTAAVPPAAGAAPAALSTGSMHYSFSVAPNAAGTLATAQVSTDPNFGSIAGTVANTANGFAEYGGLLNNTTYYGRAMALHDPAASNPDSAFTALGGASTLAKAPAAAPTFLPISLTSVTVNFTACPGGCEGYRVQASPDPAFGSLVVSSDVPSAQLTGGLTGLQPATTYYVRVGALNWNSVSSFSAVAATMTLIPVQSAGMMDAGGLNLTVIPGMGLAITSIQLLVPPLALTPGITVTLNTSVQQDLPPPVSNQANLTALGTGLGFSIDAQGTQPVGTVQVVVKYDPLLIPAGRSAKNIQMARYDPAALQWTLLPTSVDTSQNTATAQLNHFSLFAPFVVSAGADLGSINIFPIPWEPSGSDSRFNAPVLTFSNLPSNAHVRVLTIRGELLWESYAGTNGVLTWDGKNRYARYAGSGTFMVSIDSGSDHVMKRVVIAR